MNQNPPIAKSTPAGVLDRLMNGLSVFTLAMTVPQVVNVWGHSRTSGVSLLSWVAYLVAAVAWLVYGLRKHDKHIYVPCIGWIVLDAAIVAGLLLNT